MERRLLVALLIAVTFSSSTALAQAQKPRCPRTPATVRKPLAELRQVRPSIVHLGTYVIDRTPETDRLVEIGLPAVTALLDIAELRDRMNAAYAVFVLGEIFANVDDPEAGPCRDLAIAILQDLRKEYLRNPRHPGDFVVIGEIVKALRKLGIDVFIPLPPAGDCCVTKAELVTSGKFLGGWTLDHYYPDIAAGVAKRTDDPVWDLKDTAGPFDIAQPIANRRRAGVAVQFVATCTGDRAGCRFTQHYTIQESTFPHLQPKENPIDDFADVDRDQGKPPMRQDIGTDRISFADPASFPYDNAEYSNYVLRVKFESCALSSEGADCPRKKCCVDWMWELRVVDGRRELNVLTDKPARCE